MKHWFKIRLDGDAVCRDFEMMYNNAIPYEVANTLTVFSGSVLDSYIKPNFCTKMVKYSCKNAEIMSMFDHDIVPNIIQLGCELEIDQGTLSGEQLRDLYRVLYPNQTMDTIIHRMVVYPEYNVKYRDDVHLFDTMQQAVEFMKERCRKQNGS